MEIPVAKGRMLDKMGELLDIKRKRKFRVLKESDKEYRERIEEKLFSLNLQQPLDIEHAEGEELEKIAHEKNVAAPRKINESDEQYRARIKHELSIEKYIS